MVCRRLWSAVEDMVAKGHGLYTNPPLATGPRGANRSGMQDNLEPWLAHRTLEEVVRWGLAHKPPLLLSDVVVQDEFTHDAVLPVRKGVVLVYDCT